MTTVQKRKKKQSNYGFGAHWKRQMEKKIIFQKKKNKIQSKVAVSKIDRQN